MAESQQTYPYEEIIENYTKGERIELSFSRERLFPYMHRSGHKYDKAFNFYLYNARLSKAFLFPLHALEVTLRNRIQWVLSQEFSEDWHQNSTFKRMLNEAGVASLMKAEGKATSGNIEDTVANTTFEFWTYLLHNQYHDFWRTKFPSLCGGVITRGQLFTKVKRINDFRNRIAHHEPILDKPFAERYAEILDVLQHLSPEVCCWVKSHSTFKTIITTEPAPSGNPKPLLKDKADIDFALIQSNCKLIELPNKRFLICEDKETIFDLRDISKYLLAQVDEEKNLILDLKTVTVGDVIKAQNLKKNTVEFGETESFLHSKVMFQKKRVKYIIVKNSQNQTKGVIEKPHRQI